MKAATHASLHDDDDDDLQPNIVHGEDFKFVAAAAAMMSNDAFI